MRKLYRRRRAIIAFCGLVVACFAVAQSAELWQQQAATDTPTESMQHTAAMESPALAALETLPVKGRAPKTNYARTEFGSGWTTTGGCDTRNIILNRDMTDVVASDDCKVQSGTLQDPYTGTTIQFTRGASTSNEVQIDHVVALSNAWQTGAQQLSLEKRTELANDPLELLAVEGAANQQKSDGDAATWLPSNKAFRCQYVARQIAVKQKYTLWVTQAEKEAMSRVLTVCPTQTLP